MYNIQSLNKISTKGLDLFPRDEYEVASEIGHPDAIILRSYDMNEMELPEETIRAVDLAGNRQHRVALVATGKEGVFGVLIAHTQATFVVGRGETDV